VVDEAGDVAADTGVPAPAPVDPEHPDAPFGEVPLFARGDLVVADELAGVVDDARVLVDRFGREDAKAVQLRAPPNDPR
jgi:hypothetical protein